MRLNDDEAQDAPAAEEAAAAEDNADDLAERDKNDKKKWKNEVQVNFF